MACSLIGRGCVSASSIRIRIRALKYIRTERDFTALRVELVVTKSSL